MRGAAGALLALACAALPASAGPWNQAAGSFYAKAGYAYLRATELATPDGQIAEIPAFAKHEGVLYVEYGLTARLTGIADLALVRSSSIEDFDSAAGIGDSRLGLQWQIQRGGPWVLAARGVVQVPTGDETKGQALLPTGSGVWEGEATLGAGVSLWRGRGWAFAEAGHQVRGGDLRDSFVYAAQLGVRVTDRLLVLGNLRGVQPYDTTPGDASTQSAAGFGDGVTYLTFGPAAILHLGGGAGVQLDLDLATNTRNIARGPTWRFGVFLSR